MRNTSFAGLGGLVAASSLALAFVSACSGKGTSSSTASGGAGSGTGAAGTTAAGAPNGTATGTSAGGSGSTGTMTGTGTGMTTSSTGSGPCTTRVSYGDTWIHGPNHPDNFDDTTGPVTWDGTCTNDGANSFAMLSNGWKPYFNGNGGCVIAIDSTCAPVAACKTRISYGASWMAAPNHPAAYDDVDGRVMWNRGCVTGGGTSHATLTNGWTPYFSGNDSCELSFSYTDCGGLYDNPVVPVDCPDPGVIKSGSDYVAACTSGGAPAFPLRTSKDLVHWTNAGHIFPNGSTPSWATGDYWAPEIHKVGNQYVAYFTARATSGRLSVGAATAPAATGPFTDIGHPLVTHPTMGVIDPDEFDDASGKHYVVWKVDGNAVGAATPIFGQQLSADGLSLVGSPVQLITNDQGWEGPLVEGPWVYSKGGTYYLFYSANAYYNASYAVGVARSQNPLGPYSKMGPPILTSDGAFAGPGHCSVVDAPSGDTVMVYHAWLGSSIGGGPGRVMLVDQVQWENGWPYVRQAPSSHSRPMP